MDDRNLKLRCGDCRFYYRRLEECRRRSPSHWDGKRKWLAYHNSELLRDIAWSMHAIAKTEPSDDVHDDLNIEATEAAYDQRWPYVDDDEWCGEFEAKEV